MTSSKAYIAFVASFLTTLLTVWTDTDPLTLRDGVFALAAALITGGAVYQFPNQPK